MIAKLERDGPDGKAASEALLTGSDMPKTVDALKDDLKLVRAGLMNLRREGDTCMAATRDARARVLRELATAMSPLLDDLENKLTPLIAEMAKIFASAKVLAMTAGSRRNGGAMDIIEPFLSGLTGERYLPDDAFSPDPAIIAALRNAEPALQAIGRTIPDTAHRPERIIIERP